MPLTYRLLALLVMILVLGPVAAQDKRYGIRDEAELFSKDAVKKADEDLARIHEQYKKDVFIETLREGPKENFIDWARARARNHSFSGVYVVITLNPHKLEVLVDKQTREKKLFSDKNAQEMADIMLGQLRAKKIDEALRDGTQFVMDIFRKNSSQ
jgi:hypothetical protein